MKRKKINKIINVYLPLLVIMISIYVFGYYLAYKSLYDESSTTSDESTYLIQTNESIYQEEEVEEAVPDSFSHIENLHWTHMPITFYISRSCYTENLREDLRDFDYVNHTRMAFDMISNATDGLVSFKEVDYNNSDIKIICYISSWGEELEVTETEKTFMTGVSNIETEGNRITSARIELYRPYRCAKNPVTQIHEILHCFGIEHTPEDIEYIHDVMYPLEVGCNAKIGYSSIYLLKSIYGTKR